MEDRGLYRMYLITHRLVISLSILYPLSSIFHLRSCILDFANDLW
jgi:hypothetical protein